MNIKESLPIWKDWPKSGINFIDICGITTNPTVFKYVNESLSQFASSHKSTSIVAIESRGFIFGSVVANYLNLPLILVRKPNKLPGLVETVRYETEYSFDELSIQKDSIVGDRPYIIDDLLATGGTLIATSKLIGKKNIRCGVIINLSFLSGVEKLKKNNIECDFLVNYDD